MTTGPKNRGKPDHRESGRPGYRTPKERVYAAYVDWCKKMGEEALTRRSFTGRMRNRGIEDKSVRIAGKAHKCWVALTLKAAEEG